MATTAQARQLTEAHRLAQARLGVRTIEQMSRLWSIIDIADLPSSQARWLTATGALVESQHMQSSNLAAAYVSRFRFVEVGDAGARIELVAPDLARVATSLEITGTARLRQQLTQGVTETAALRQAESTAARSALRLALAGGRQTVIDAAQADPKALGWQRVTSGNPCAFCATLAINGPIINFRGPTRRNFQAHDSCMCTAEIVYSERSEPPPGVARFKEIYNEATAGVATGGQLNAFRRALVGT